MRLFLAVFPSRDCAERLGRALGSLPSDPALRWIDPSTAHFTLAFLGETPDPARPAAALERACARSQPFRAAFGDAGAFDSWDRPKIVWLGLSAGAEPMTRLAESVRAELEAERVAFDPKPFVPHLTLARAQGRPRPNLRAALDAELARGRLPEMQVDAADLVSSQSGPGGPVYASIRRERLCAA